ncbi:hypothetical protein FE257_009275 [Aspergillus nanangensis]|uniref:ASST-domain-containing protein n=1 Tax=Aspergillus nanangensis TaxID=2582783 RepID=A0AAD4CKD9_ASPNN|nr:hypothetical protein FE257_009275 [Aspergillus nanangensis]
MPSDVHEFRIIDNETAIIAIYQPRQYSLEAYNIPSGWVVDGVFQEINITTKEVLFEWRSLDHVPLSDTYSPLGATEVIGNGQNETTAWDYFHINSVDKNSEGDYLVSARHTSCIYKISGQDGSVDWRLGGKQSSISLTDYNFSAQHDARFREENETHTVLSLFDNASDKHRTTSPTSSGKIVTIDHTTNSSTLTKQYQAPGAGILSISQGNLQVLPQGNVFIGWGSNPSISEHTETGTPVYFATLLGPGLMNYRAFKANWTAHPIERPTLNASASSTAGENTTTFWVSWNGATDVKFWNFYATLDGSDQFALLAKADNNGFQTTLTSSDHHPQAFVEGLSADELSLGNSSIVAL